MSRPRTKMQAIEALDDEFAWRQRELIVISQEVRRSSEPWTTTLVRASVPLLYAHWEGYIKKAAEVLTSFVIELRLPYKDLSYQMRALGARHKLTAFRSANPGDSIDALIWIDRMGDLRPRFAPGKWVDTESNLSSVVFSRILAWIGIPAHSYESRFQQIDKELLNRRNHIAHGQSLTLERMSYISLQKDILLLMRMFKNDLQNYIMAEGYLFSPK